MMCCELGGKIPEQTNEKGTMPLPASQPCLLPLDLSSKAC